MDDRNFELELKNQLDIRNNFWTATLVTASGTLSLVINPDSITKWLLIFLGFAFFVFFLRGYFSRVDIVDKLDLKHKRRQVE